MTNKIAETARYMYVHGHISVTLAVSSLANISRSNISLFMHDRQCPGGAITPESRLVSSVPDADKGGWNRTIRTIADVL